KFAVSFVLYLVAWAWMMQFVDRAKKLAWRLGTLITIAGVIEMVLIVGQVIRGKRSHFNVATPLDTVLWSIMGSTIVVLMIGQIALGVLVLRGRYADAAMRSAVLFGLLISTVGMGLA